MEENALTKVARIAAGSAMGATYKDKDGKQQVIKPTGDANYLDLSGVITNSGSSNDGGGDNPSTPDNPSAGADYYAGDLYAGEITGRKLEWFGNDDPGKDTIVKFNDDPGANPFGQYSGLTIIGHIQKTIMTSGTKGNVSELKLNFDPNNKSKDGCFTTTSPYPIYIKQSDLVGGQRLSIPIEGIGEGTAGANIKVPTLYLTYNADRTMTISHDTGYNNDGNSAGSTGANYDFVVELIATFSVQKAVTQLPNSVNLFSGSSSGDIALSGSSESFDNCNHGLVIKFDTWIQKAADVNGGLEYSKTVDFGVTDIEIDKIYLITGFKLDQVEPKLKNTGTLDCYSYAKFNGYSLDPDIKTTINSIKLNEVSIESGALNVEIAVSETSPYSHSNRTEDLYFKVATVNTLEA